MEPPTFKAIRITVLESDPVRFLGLRSIVACEPDMEICAATVQSVLQGIEDEIVLISDTKGTSFFAAMTALKAVRPTLPIIVTGPGGSDDDILRAITAGAKGYVSEEASGDEFKRAIREVHAGSVWAPGRVLATFIERSTAPERRTPTQGNEDKISEREREVLRLLVAGCSNGEIADELGIGERTVKAHVAQLLRKVGVQNRIALSVHAVTHSLLSTRH
jgi:DNA-binding NarL/FixJ family response regulator